MSEDARVIQGIDWRRTFPFTHLFRSFRIAIHPSKLLLALIALLLLYGGGRVLDSAAGSLGYRAAANDVVNEIDLYGVALTQSDFINNKMKDVVRDAGLFHTFFAYEVAEVDRVVKGVRNGIWVGGPGNVTHAIKNFIITGPAWAFSQHPFFFVIFGLWFLLVWSIFGGAIARIAAIHVARDEKLSIRQALRFSVGKLLSFLFAPVIPLLIVLVVGLAITVVSLFANIPYLRQLVLIAIGALFFLALAAGFVMTLVMLGTIGGFNLMYPTIAVEGSDSFDAISRSFSYLYARPWRMAFYTIIAIAYGAACYLFVRLFIWLMLVLTHYFVDVGMFAQVGGHELINAIWQSPMATGRLVYRPDYALLNWGEKTGAFLIACWVYLAIAMLGAFAISFYFSANTVIYYLMRQEVDATELDDVYVEQSDEEFAENPAIVTPGAAPAAEVTPPSSPEAPQSAPPAASEST